MKRQTRLSLALLKKLDALDDEECDLYFNHLIGLQRRLKEIELERQEIILAINEAAQIVNEVPEINEDEIIKQWRNGKLLLENMSPEQKAVIKRFLLSSKKRNLAGTT